MIAGLGGGLVSHAYVERQVLPAAGADVARFERRLGRWWRQVSRTLGPASSARSVLDVAAAPLLQLLDHGPPAMRAHAMGLAGIVAGSGAVLVCLPWSTPARLAWREAARCGIESGAAWALICNGRSLKVVDCARPWSRAGIEFDFETALASPKGVAALWLLVNATAIARPGPGSLRARVTESDAHAARVCHLLGDGVLAALPRLAGALSGGRTAAGRLPGFDQALTVIYRILFLLFAEARGLVPVWHELYRDAYTIESLARRACGTGNATGLWSALQAISRLAHAGCKAGGVEVTAFNGRLFSPRHAPLVEQRRVPDATVRDVLLSLSTEATRLGRRRISYHDLGVEELGAVYERVLEYEPRPHGPGLVLTRTSVERKTTGSFYTPRSITGFLVRRTLAPLVEGRAADQILALRILDPAMGSGAFLVAACHYLADHCELALVREGQWNAPEVTPADRAGLRRQIAERCLYGVDLNPTAVQLARLSLWLTTLAAARPLTFLDHHLATGNSLLGARLGDLSRPPRARAPAVLPLFDEELAAAVSTRVLPERLRLALTPSDSLDAVKGKERLLAALLAADGPIAQWSLAADAWCAAALWPGAPPATGLVAEWIAAATHGPTTLPAARLQASLAQARDLAARHGAFHWELAFPEVFLDDRGRPAAGGGFDAVIGNPPWDMLRADLGSAAARADAREATAAALRFFRTSGLYLHQGQGHANRYQLFLERALQLVRAGGRIGLILPSGIATDRGSASLRHYLFDRTTIDTWLGFDNRRRIFPIHRSVRFVLLSTTRGGRTDSLSFRCGLDDAAALERGDETTGTALLTVTRSRLEAWSADLTVPEIPDATALGLVTTIAGRVPALAAESGWGVRFGRELNATDDRPHFVALGASRPGALLPIVEGKQLAPFHLSLDRSAAGIPRRAAAQLLDAAATFDRPRIGYRDVAGATNKLTLIAAMLPAGTVSTHTVFCSKTALDDESQWCLLGLLNSLVANYLVRRQVTTHVTTALIARLPVPRPSPASAAFKQLASLARAISTVGIDAAADDYAALNAIAAALYGVSPDQYRYIVGTFPLLAEDLRSRCLAAFQTLTQKHGNTKAKT